MGSFSNGNPAWVGAQVQHGVVREHMFMFLTTSKQRTFR